jgi:hypothetical protein
LRVCEQKCVSNCSRWDWIRRRSLGLTPCPFQILQRLRSRLHKEASIGGRPPSALATVMSTVRPARSGMSSTNTAPPFRGTGADFHQVTGVVNWEED